jgi:hypothetical protein
MSDVRASDADRERAATALREHCAAGRLTVDELEERMAAAYAAVTVAELERLFTDLPAAAPEHLPAPRRRRVPRGRLAFSTHHDLPIDAAGARLNALEHIAPQLSAHGYRLVVRDRDALVFELRWRPAWTILVAIFAFPFGLLALLHLERDEIELDFEPAGRDRTRMIVHGVGPRAVRQAFADLEV